MTLKEMYWLDINPVTTGWVFRAGMGRVDASDTSRHQPVVGYAIVTNWSKTNGAWTYQVSSNAIVSITMMITNTEDSTIAPYAPYVLQGSGVGETSTNSAAFPNVTWAKGTNPVFAIPGALQKPAKEDGAVDPRSDFKPLRWFVFQPGSFDPVSFSAQIEIADPYFIGAQYDWGPYRGVYPVFFRWDLDDADALKPRQTDVEVLESDSTYDHATPPGATP